MFTLFTPQRHFQQCQQISCVQLKRWLLVHILVWGFSLLTGHVWAQTPALAPDTYDLSQRYSDLDGRKVYSFVTSMPVYKNGGNKGLIALIKANYHLAPPPGAKELFLKFVVDQTGKPRNPMVITGTPLPVPESTQQEAARIFSTVGDFTPGRQKGKLVDVELTFPVSGLSTAGK
ncbi:MAG TPA: hypothetical protein VF598_06950 [Hymenobacter sp.]|jgi:hypothetical protein